MGHISVSKYAAGLNPEAVVSFRHGVISSERRSGFDKLIVFKYLAILCKTAYHGTSLALIHAVKYVAQTKITKHFRAVT
jgi:hypothetical protein